jgi:hypothetical protein
LIPKFLPRCNRELFAEKSLKLSLPAKILRIVGLGAAPRTKGRLTLDQRLSQSNTITSA